MFHFRAKIIGRATPGAKSVAGAVAYRVGSRSGAAAMAYRAGEKLRDPNSGNSFDYRKKAALDADGFGILHTELMLPVGAPEWMADRQLLIDAIEAKEKRADAQLLREIELSLPRELTFEQQRDLLHEFVQVNFVSRGMIADVAMHDERASDGGRNPHAHILLTMRALNSEGFGAKVRAWNAPQLLKDWRSAWAEMANEMLARHGHERRLDARSHAARGIELEPDAYQGPSKGRVFEGVINAERRESRNAAKQRNVSAISSNPEKLIAAVAGEKATFTGADLAAALVRTTGFERDAPEFSHLMAAVLESNQLVAIASDDRGLPRFATREMIACETSMAKAASALAHRRQITASAPAPDQLSVEQVQAYRHAIQGPDFVAICGIAGAGKTTVLASVARAFEAAGHRVRGAALAGVAAKKLSEEAAIPASTLASLFHAWDRDAQKGHPAPDAVLRRGDVLIVDEAGMIASREMSRLLVEADRVQAKVIVVGDAQQLEAIGAGAAFRTLVDTHGAAELTEIKRQRESWQRAASGLLAQHQAEAAVGLYRDAGAVHGAASSEAAMDQLVGTYLAVDDANPSKIILAHYKADVTALNDKVRAGLRVSGKIGADVKVVVREQVRDENGDVLERAQHAVFATGDKILFTKNSRALGVQNGSVGRVLAVEAQGSFRVEMEDGKAVSFHTRDYNHLALGYALTIHKAQGATYDRTFVLASRRMDARLAYVALTRHRHETSIHYGRDQFPRERDLEQSFSRQRPKDSTLDYLDAYRNRQRGKEQVGEGASRKDETRAAPLSVADRIRMNVLRRQQAETRNRGRDRNYGE